MTEEQDRIILHCDLNCFFASVELLSHPDLREVPTAVCGDPASRHGIILAKNEPAKRLGIVTAETIWQARKKCPSLVLLPPHHELYRSYSKKVNDIYGQYTDLVEPFGIDESWLDLTGSAHLFGGDPKEIADEIRGRVRRELGLTLSVGVSFNKVFAKLGSDYKKPDATTVISRENWRAIVWPLPVGVLLFAGRAARQALEQHGIRTVGELAACPPEVPETLLGKMGRQLWDYANGLEHEPVRSRYDREPVKSVGSGTTFSRDLTTRDQARSGIDLLADSVAVRLRRCGMYAGGVQLTLRTPDFKTISRQKQFSSPTHLMRELSGGAMELLNSAWKPPAPIRMLTVTAISLTPSGETFEQEDLFAADPSDRERRGKLELAMDGIRGKYGMDAIRFGKKAADGGELTEGARKLDKG
jgi:Nucleotidyltransferase/DNA polymerase involved in DNA repair